MRIFLTAILLVLVALSCKEVTMQSNTSLLDFDSDTPTFHYFANGHLSKENYSFKVVPDPKSPKNKVGKIIKASDASKYAGVYFETPTIIDFTKKSSISMAVLMDHPGSISIKLENSPTGGPDFSVAQKITKPNQWQTLTFDYSNTSAIGHQYKRLTIFPDLYKEPTGKDVVTYFDEIIVAGKKIEPVVNPRYKIVVLGSSTAAGVGPAHQDSAWVNRYRNQIKNQYQKDVVLNISKGGYTTYQLLPTGSVSPADRPQPDTLRNVSAAIRHGADAVIINLPSNDTSIGVSVEKQLENFEKLMSFLAKANIKTWVATTQPRNYPEDKRLIQKRVRDSLLARYGDYCINFWDDFAQADNTLKKEFDSGDGVHMNDSGHGLLEKSVRDKQIVLQLAQKEK